MGSKLINYYPDLTLGGQKLEDIYAKQSNKQLSNLSSFIDPNGPLNSAK